MTTQIKEFTKTEAALSDLESRYSEVPDCETKDGYQLARLAISELRGYRTSLDKKRLALGKEAREHINMVNGEAKRITGRLVALEDPMKEAKKAVDDEKLRLEQEAALKEVRRISAIEGAITWIKNSVYVDRNTISINEAIGKLNQFDMQQFQEFTDVAERHMAESLAELNDMLSTAVAAEEQALHIKKESERLAEIERKQAAQQAEIDKEQKEVSRKQAEIVRKEALEAGKVAEAKREKEETARAEKQKELEVKRIIAGRIKFKSDAKILANISIYLRGATPKLYAFENEESRDIFDKVIDMVSEITNMIDNSAVVRSQRNVN